MTAWERYWFGPVAAVRPYLLMRVVYAVLALDVWVVQVPRGSRYGIDGFNVAHFAWLDAVQPLPSPALYVGLMLSVGLLALVCALADPGRSARALVALLYTYGWAMSQHDAYQHHYFLSLVLTLFVFFPRLRGGDLAAAARASVSAWAYVLLAVTVSVVYTFAGAAKLDAAWRAGEILRVLDYRLDMAPLEAWAEGIGISSGWLWSAMSWGTVAMEWSLAAVYLTAARRDDPDRRVIRLIAWPALLIAVAFHASAEVVLRLRIGWFSYYMLAFACVYFLPAAPLRAVTAAAMRRAAQLALLGRRAPAPALGAVAIAGAAIALVGVGFVLDLPGGQAVGVAAASVLVGAALGSRLIGRRPPLARYGLVSAVAAVVLWAAIAASGARFHYYMMAGRLHERLGERAAALDAVETARRYGAVSLRGIWRGGDSSIRVSVRDSVATGIFLRVGADARQLGFKPGDVSFVANVRGEGELLNGQQTLRYRDACHPEGRPVPMIGLVGLGGNVLTIYCYTFPVDIACQDTGEYSVIETVWRRD